MQAGWGGGRTFNKRGQNRAKRSPSLRSGFNYDPCQYLCYLSRPPGRGHGSVFGMILSIKKKKKSKARNSDHCGLEIGIDVGRFESLLLLLLVSKDVN